MMKTKNNLVQLVLMSILTVAATIVFTACSNYMEYDTENQMAAQKSDIVTGQKRTVLVYMAGRNNLSYFATLDLEEMKRGSKRLGKDQALLVFMRRSQNGEEPWLARIEDGQLTGKVTVSEMGIRKDELYASDPDVMEKVMSYAFSHYPSVNDDYGLVLWGHAGGWLLQDSVRVETSRGYGVDVGNYIYSSQGKWINIPTMNQVLSRLPHLKFILADCCNFMCLETLYELRNVADYVIGSPAEIPDTGAPYEAMAPAMFEATNYYHAIMECYQQHTEGNLPLSVVKTSEMEHVAQATKKVLQSIKERNSGYADLTGLIHYNFLGPDSVCYKEYNIFYDAGHFISRYATTSEYQEWKKVLDTAVIEKCMAYRWRTGKRWDGHYTDFEMSQEAYHGVSLFVPQDPTVKHAEHYADFNNDIFHMQWQYATR